MHITPLLSMWPLSPCNSVLLLVSACKEVEKVRMELHGLKNEKGHLINQFKELGKGSVLLDTWMSSRFHQCTSL